MDWRTALPSANRFYLGKKPSAYQTDKMSKEVTRKATKAKVTATKTNPTADRVTKVTKLTIGATPRRGAPSATRANMSWGQKRTREEMVKRYGEKYTSLVQEANARNRRALEGGRAEAENKRGKRKAPETEVPAAASGPKRKRTRERKAPGRPLESKPIEVLLQRASPNLPARMRHRPWYTGIFTMWTPSQRDVYCKGWWYPDGVDGFVRYQPQC
ncbi:hypothetical protein TWF718_003021 [Orbilia javanica]|uniref:Uncharacterized protein n=1 Tax=Orbilia javanica TaxID=47235 RepID=A0AAN8MFF3_9PEZI